MNKIQAAVVMGSDSDLPVMKSAVEMLEKFGIGCIVDLVSAHRTPHRTAAFVGNAVAQGVKVFIAGAGGAAHLAGVLAAETYLPVIAVPMRSRISIEGLDSLLSMVQMPTGVPVATVGIDRADNAGILAAQIIATSDEEVAARLVNYKKELAQSVETKSAKLQALGYKKYLETK